MADIVFNAAKGRVVELYNRVNDNDPATSGLIVTLWKGAGTDATLKDLDTLAEIEADGGFSESTDGAYVRKVLTDTELAASSPDDTNDRYEVDIPDQTWTGGMTGETLTRLIIFYAPDVGGSDSTFVPLIALDSVTTTDGTDVFAKINALGFFRAV